MLDRGAKGLAGCKEVARMTHDGPVRSVVFSPDGRYAISDSDDEMTRVWVYPAENFIAKACAHLTRNLIHAEWDQYIGNGMQYMAICKNLPVEPDVTITPTATP
jgi:WD40 repeat protein